MWNQNIQNTYFSAPPEKFYFQIDNIAQYVIAILSQIRCRVSPRTPSIILAGIMITPDKK
jgi:hypothetical protein